VVYDRISGQPVEGVTVTIEGSSGRTATGANGAYWFKNIRPGTYTVAFSKDGYRLKTAPVTVNPNQYTDDDPFKEWQALQWEYAALQEWIKLQGSPIPGYDGMAGDISWTYQNGVWVSGTGTTAVAYTVEGGPRQYQVKPVSLDYQYSKAIPLYLTGLTPLSGGIKGRVSLVFTRYDQSLTVPGDTQPAEGAVLWFEEVDGYVLGTGNSDGQGNETKIKALYGPVTTGSGGYFELPGLPGETAFKLYAGTGFTRQKDGREYFFPVDEAYRVTEGELKSLSSHSIRTAADAGELAVVDAGPIYLFTAGEFAYVTSISAGTPSLPLALNGGVKLTFNRPIDPAAFSALFTTGTGLENNTGLADGLSSPLSPLWASNNQEVTLTLQRTMEGNLQPGFPYSRDQNLPAGTITITAKTLDGSAVYNYTGQNKLKVFTAERMRLTGVDLNPKELPAARLALSAKAIKLTFNRTVGTAEVRWSGDPAVPAPCTLSEDRLSVFVWTDALNQTPQNLICTVSALDEPSNIIKGEEIKGEFTKARLANPLALTACNLYPGTVAGDPRSADAKFPVSGVSYLVLNNSVPFGAETRAGLYTTEPASFGPSEAALTVGVDAENANILASTPAAPLRTGTEYFLAVEVRMEGETIFSSRDAAYLDPLAGAPKIVDKKGANGSCSIAFTTASPEKLVLASANLYAGQGGVSGGPSGDHSEFPTAGDITLGFTNGIPSAALVSAGLYTAEPGNAPGVPDVMVSHSISAGDRKILTLTPRVQLDSGSAYYLAIRITVNGDLIFATSKDFIDANARRIIATERANTCNIKFTTVTAADLQLRGTNIYAPPEGVYTPSAPSAAGANFPVDGEISLNFQSIPPGARVRAALYRRSIGANSISLAAGYPKIDGTSVKIKPYAKLEAGDSYYLAAEILSSGGAVLFSTQSQGFSVLYKDSLKLVDTYHDSSGYYIAFNTRAAVKLVNKGVNSATSFPPTGNITAGRVYRLQFDQAIPGVPSGTITSGSGLAIAAAPAQDAGNQITVNITLPPGNADPPGTVYSGVSVTVSIPGDYGWSRTWTGLAVEKP
jgi:hypothetical protein